MVGSRARAGWVFRSRRRTAVVIVGVFLLGLVLTLGAAVSCTRAVRSDPTELVLGRGGGAGALSVDNGGCARVAGTWGGLLLDRTLSGEQWDSRLSQFTVSGSRQGLSGVSRESLPDGPVTGVKVQSDGGSCQAWVEVGGSVPFVALTLVRDGSSSVGGGRSGSWMVSDWSFDLRGGQDE